MKRAFILPNTFTNEFTYKQAAILTLLVFVGSLLAFVSAASSQGFSFRPILIPSSEMPTVAIRVLFETGSGDDPAGKEGLCSLSGRTIAGGGTPGLTHSQVLGALYPYAAQINVQVDKDYTVFTTTFHREVLETIYPIFRDLVTMPRWDTADFRRELNSAENYINRELISEDDEELGKAALEKFIYDNGPYGHPIRGTTKGLESITLEDVQQFAETHFGRARMRVGIAGAYPKMFPSRVMTDLNLLPEGRSPRHVIPKTQAINGIQVLCIDKNAPATAISLGFPVELHRRHPDYWPLLLVNHWFGEHRTFYGRLMNVMRVDRGLNYGDYSYIEAYRQGYRTRYALPNTLRRGQFFSIWIRPVEPANGHFALRQALRELVRLNLNGLPEKDFATAKMHLLNYSKLWNQGLQRRLGMAMDDAITETGAYVSRIESELAKMTLEDVNAAIRRHLQADNIKVVMVCGKTRGIAEAIYVNAQSPITYAAGTAPKTILEEDVLIQDYTLGVTEVEIVPADEIFRERGF